MPETEILNLAHEIDRILDQVQAELCPTPEILPTSPQKRARFDRRCEMAARNRLMTEQYFGLDGNGGRSMEQVGSPVGLTRESVRQITNKVALKLSRMNGIPREAFLSAIKMIQDKAPVERGAMMRQLIDQGIWSEGKDITALLAASKILLVDEGAELAEQLVCISENGAEYIVFKKQGEWPKLIVSVAMRLISHNGATTVDQIVKKFPKTVASRRKTLVKKALQRGEDVSAIADEPAPVVDAQLVRDVLKTQECCWLDDEGQWFTMEKAKRNRVKNRLNKIFSCYQSALLIDVSEAINRSLQKTKGKSATLLPVDVLQRFIESLKGYTVVDGRVSYSGRMEKVNILPAEKAMIDFIASSEEGIRREKELEEGVVNMISRRIRKTDPEPTIKYTRKLANGEPEINEFGFSMALNFSPLILSVMSRRGATQVPERVRGQYRLVGQLR